MSPLLFGEYVFVKFCAFWKELKLKYRVEYLQIFTINRKRKSTCVHTYITTKRIELESPCWSGFETL